MDRVLLSLGLQSDMLVHLTWQSCNQTKKPLKDRLTGVWTNSGIDRQTKGQINQIFPVFDVKSRTGSKDSSTGILHYVQKLQCLHHVQAFRISTKNWEKLLRQTPVSQRNSFLWNGRNQGSLVRIDKDTIWNVYFIVILRSCIMYLLCVQRPKIAEK